MENPSKGVPAEAGKSSYELVDIAAVLGELGLKKGNAVLDLGCGRGQYALAIAEAMTDQGRVYAVDLWNEGIEDLRAQAAARNLSSVEASVGDIGDLRSIGDGSVDLIFMAAVFHDLVIARSAERVLREVARVLRAGGSLSIVEFKKIDGPPGPSLRSRLSPEEVEEWVTPWGFQRKRVVEVGPHNYMMRFEFHGAS